MDKNEILKEIYGNEEKTQLLDKTVEIPAPQTMKELYNTLHEAGKKWREANTVTEFYTNGEKKGQVKSKKTALPRPLDVANILKKTCYFVFIGRGITTDQNLLYLYNLDEGIYIASVDIFNKLCIEFDSRLRSKHFREIQIVLRTMTKLKEPLSDRNLIPVKNGIFDLKRKALLPFSPSYIIKSKINTAYHDKPMKPILDKWFDFDEWLKSIACNDEDIVTLLWQIMNEAINPNYTRGKMAILYGEGNNGKGTFQSLLINLIGAKNISNLKPNQFEESFQLSTLEGKVCNIGDDISNKYLDEVSDLMSVVTGDSVHVNPKHQQPYEAVYKCFCLFSGNELPKARAKNQGWYRRLCIVPFNADFNGQKEKPEIKNQYLKDERLLEWVLYRILNLEKFDKFIEPQAVKELLSEYKINNDFYFSFVTTFYIPNGYHELQHVPLAIIKDWLKDFTSNEGINDPNLYGHGQKVTALLNKETKNKYTVKSFRVSEKDKKRIAPQSWQEKSLIGSVKGIYKQ